MQDIHTHIDDWIAAALAGDLSLEEQIAFDRHLQEDGGSRALFEETKAMSHAIEETLQADRPGPGFEARMISGFREKTAKPGIPLISRFAGWLRTPLVYIPATAVVLFGMVIIGSRVANEPWKSGESSTREVRQYSASWSSSAFGGVRSGGAPVSRIASAQKDGVAPQPMEAPAMNASMAVANGETGDSRVIAPPPAPNSTQTVVKHKYASSIYSTTASSLAGGPQPMDKATPGEPAKPQALLLPAVTDNRKLIRNASVQLEVKSYNEALDAIDALARGCGGYVDTRNSDRLPNGRESGTVVIKVPPSALDGSLVQLHALGDVKNQSLSTEDVTAQYYDTDARLRNARKMEDRLLDLLNTVKGRVSDLLAVEKELGRVRESIEEMQGRLKLYDSQVQYATITISLREKDMNAPAAYLLRENVSLSLYAPGVEKAFAAARREAEAVHARVVRSSLAQEGSGSLRAVLSLEIDPANADSLIDRIRTLGRVEYFARHEESVAKDGGEDPLSRPDGAAAKVEHGPVILDLTILAAMAKPVQFTDISVRSSSVEQQAARIRQAAAGFEVRGSTFERAADGSESAGMSFRLPLDRYPAFLGEIQKLGEVKNLTIRRQDPDDGGTANAVAEISLRIYSQAGIVGDNNGLFATLRRTLAEGFGGLMWSVRMIGVAAAFLIPWALAIVAVTWVIRRISRSRSGKK